MGYGTSAPFWLVIFTSIVIILSVAGTLVLMWRDYHKIKKHHYWNDPPKKD